MPRKLRGPIASGDTRNDELEYSALMIDSPSATIVPLPTVLRNGVSCLTSVPKFEPVCATRRQVVAEAPQVVDDVGAVAEQVVWNLRLVSRAIARWTE